MINDQLQQALVDCNAAVDLNPNAAGAIANRAFVYLRLGDPDRAIAEYGAALELEPKNAHALYGRGLAERREGDHVAADADIAAAQVIRSDIGDTFITASPAFMRPSEHSAHINPTYTKPAE